MSSSFRRSPPRLPQRARWPEPHHRARIAAAAALGSVHGQRGWRGATATTTARCRNRAAAALVTAAMLVMASAATARQAKAQTPASPVPASSPTPTPPTTPAVIPVVAPLPPPPPQPAPAASPVSSGPLVAAAYRLPLIALVQPASATGGLLLQDRPVAVFRFAASGEPGDPLDLGSFRVAVDGQDRTALFQVQGAEAWGPLAPSSSATPIALGAHTVAARICSSHGACGEVTATLTVVAGTTVQRTDVGAATATPLAESRKARVLDLMINAARRVLAP